MKQKGMPPAIPDSFSFRLREPVSYAFDGERVRCDEVSIHAPGVKLLIQSYALRQMIAKAVMASSAFAEKISSYRNDKLLVEDAAAMDAAAMDAGKSPAEEAKSVSFFMTFSDLNMPLAIDEFRDLCICGCVQVNNNPITECQWDEIRDDDKLDIFMQFVAVFMMPSIFPETEPAQKMTEEGLKS